MISIKIFLVISSYMHHLHVAVVQLSYPCKICYIADISHDSFFFFNAIEIRQECKRRERDVIERKTLSVDTAKVRNKKKSQFQVHACLTIIPFHVVSLISLPLCS